MRAGDKSLTVRDPNLAGGLFALGILPDPTGFADTFVHDGRKYSCWRFLSGSVDGVYKTAELIAGWQDPETFNARFPHHPWSFIMMAFRNAAGFREMCNSKAPKVIIRRGPSLAIVDAGGDPAIRNHILQKVGV